MGGGQTHLFLYTFFLLLAKLLLYKQLKKIILDKREKKLLER